MKQPRIFLTLLLLLLLGFVSIGAGLAHADASIRIMPLGDSITYDSLGEDDPRPAGERTGYRQKLWLLLEAAGYSVDFVGSLQAGQDASPDFDPDNEGHPGFRDDQIAVNVYGWLEENPADIVLLHIGTNELNISPDDVEDILNEIDRYEANHGASVAVFLARIINRASYSSTTTTFNNNVADMANARVDITANPAYPDRIVIVNMENMENGEGLVYSIDTTSPYTDGDMYDNLHPNVSGYDKMAQEWFSELSAYLGLAGQGSITIAKATQPAGGTGFGFTGDLGAFALDDGQNLVFSGLEARNYRITESLPPGWQLQGAVCTGGASSSITGGVTVHLGPAEDITCTFTNSPTEEAAAGTYLDDGSGLPAYFSFTTGILNGIVFDGSIDALVLDSGAAGVYTSQVFDAGVNMDWGGIEWLSNVGELPNEGLTNESVDLLGNVLLFHLNKDAAFGETDTVVHDFSGSGHTGTASGAGVSVGAGSSGKFSGGYAADAADDAGRIQVGTSPDFDFAGGASGGFSVFLWFNKSGVCDSPDNDNEVMASRFGTGNTTNTWWLGCGFNGGDRSNKLVLGFYHEQTNYQVLQSAAAINDGQWHHAGWVYDPAAAEVRLYLDGTLVDSGATTPDPFTSVKPLCIGAYGDTCDTYEFVGKLDEVAVFKRDLAADEVRGLYNRGVAGLNLRVRSCDDPACSGESFIDIGDVSPQPLSLAGRYFQYAFDFTTASAGHSPELYHVTVSTQALPAPDIDGDGDVDGADLYLFMLSYGKSSGSPGFDARCDLSPDGVVDAADLGIFAGQYGK